MPELCAFVGLIWLLFSGSKHHSPPICSSLSLCLLGKTALWCGWQLFGIACFYWRNKWVRNFVAVRLSPLAWTWRRKNMPLASRQERVSGAQPGWPFNKKGPFTEARDRSLGLCWSCPFHCKVSPLLSLLRFLQLFGTFWVRNWPSRKLTFLLSSLIQGPSLNFHCAGFFFIHCTWC